MAGIVCLGARAVDVEDDGCGLPHAHLGAAGGFQEVLDDDPVPGVILHRQDHSLTVGHLLKAKATSRLSTRLQDGTGHG